MSLLVARSVGQNIIRNGTIRGEITKTVGRNQPPEISAINRLLNAGVRKRRKPEFESGPKKSAKLKKFLSEFESGPKKSAKLKKFLSGLKVAAGATKDVGTITLAGYGLYSFVSYYIDPEKTEDNV